MSQALCWCDCAAYVGLSYPELGEVSESELRPKFFDSVKTVYWPYMSLGDYVG